MTYLNPCLGMAVIAVVIFALILAIEPKAATWLAHVLLARARAVEEARKTFARVRRSDIVITEEVKVD